jgi:hypothetical protein
MLFRQQYLEKPGHIVSPSQVKGLGEKRPRERALFGMGQELAAVAAAQKWKSPMRGISKRGG